MTSRTPGALGKYLRRLLLWQRAEGEDGLLRRQRLQHLRQLHLILPGQKLPEIPKALFLQQRPALIPYNFVHFQKPPFSHVGSL